MVRNDRKQRLNDVGFVWDVLAEAWDEGYTNLLKFREVEGHCKVSNTFRLGQYPLGQWVSIQRKVKNSMSSERKQRLDDIGFIWDASKDKT